MWASGVLLFVMLLGMFPFEMEDESYVNTAGLYSIWIQQIRTSWVEAPANAAGVARLSAECRDLLDKVRCAVLCCVLCCACCAVCCVCCDVRVLCCAVLCCARRVCAWGERAHLMVVATARELQEARTRPNRPSPDAHTHTHQTRTHPEHTHTPNTHTHTHAPTPPPKQTNKPTPKRKTQRATDV